jgi:hypothetical protein
VKVSKGAAFDSGLPEAHTRAIKTVSSWHTLRLWFFQAIGGIAIRAPGERTHQQRSEEVKRLESLEFFVGREKSCGANSCFENVVPI